MVSFFKGGDFVEINNSLPIIDYSDNETGCCPKFHPENWDEKIFNFDELKFIKASTKSFMYMPINMSSVMTKTMADIHNAKAETTEQYLILSKDVSKWKCDHYFLVASDVPSYENLALNGNYYAKVYDGAFKELPKWMTEFEGLLKKKGYNSNDMMAIYTTCPKCASHYGHNYIVLFSKVS